MTSLALIEAAAERLRGHARETPLLNAPLLDAIARRRVLVKAECLQLTGSFKFRGGWSAISALPPDARAKGVLAYSSGNHAQGVALAAQRHGIPCTILSRLAGRGFVVTDDQALRAMSLAFAHLRIVLEPGGAVALAAALFAPDLPDTVPETVIVTASGGNVDPATFRMALDRFPA